MENETSDVQPKCQGPLQLLSPPVLMTSTTKQMRPNGREGSSRVLATASLSSRRHRQQQHRQRCVRSDEVMDWGSPLMFGL